jgi:DNA-binding phage protein
MRPLLVTLEDGEAHTLQQLRGTVAGMLGVSQVRYSVGVSVRETFDLKEVDELFFED